MKRSEVIRFAADVADVIINQVQDKLTAPQAEVALCELVDNFYNKHKTKSLLVRLWPDTFE